MKTTTEMRQDRKGRFVISRSYFVKLWNRYLRVWRFSGTYTSLDDARTAFNLIARLRHD